MLFLESKKKTMLSDFVCPILSCGYKTYYQQINQLKNDHIFSKLSEKVTPLDWERKKAERLK